MNPLLLELNQTTGLIVCIAAGLILVYKVHTKFSSLIVKGLKRAYILIFNKKEPYDEGISVRRKYSSHHYDFGVKKLNCSADQDSTKKKSLGIFKKIIIVGVLIAIINIFSHMVWMGPALH